MNKKHDPMDEIFINPALDLTHEHNGKAIACVLMKNVMYDNGMVNRWEPEKYPIDVVEKIAEAARPFFIANPELLTEETLDNIASGEHGEVQALYGSLEGFKELNDILNAWFNKEL